MSYCRTFVYYFYTQIRIKNYLETFLIEVTIREMKHAKFVTLWTKKYIYEQSHFTVLFIISYVAACTFTPISSNSFLPHECLWNNSIYTLRIFVTVIENTIVTFNIINFNNKSLSFQFPILKYNKLTRACKMLLGNPVKQN